METPQKPQKLSYGECRNFLSEIAESGSHVQLNPEKHLVVASRDATVLWEIRLPLPFPAIYDRDQSLNEYLKTVPEEIPTYMTVLVQAGAAALGYFEEGEVVLHKAIKKYMKRHSQGKSQINYLKTRGKSKAGSRIRLANTVTFFEEINERLTEWEDEFSPQRILYSCTATLWGLLFQSKIPPPFEKKDSRLIKIPRDVQIPDFEELLRINRLSVAGWLTKAEI